MGDIKEIRDAALAYYHNLSAKQKREAYNFFQTMDKDDDGTITMEEFKQKFEVCFGDNVNRAFQDLDKNGDGSLDFEESITLYYCLKARRIISCVGCKAYFLMGLYFTCVDCFEHNQTTTFDLCTSCYRSRNYSHEHCNFLDNYALLRTKAAYFNSRSTSQLKALKAVSKGIELLNAAGKIAEIAQCTIM